MNRGVKSIDSNNVFHPPIKSRHIRDGRKNSFRATLTFMYLFKRALSVAVLPLLQQLNHSRTKRIVNSNRYTDSDVVLREYTHFANWWRALGYLLLILTSLDHLPPLRAAMHAGDDVSAHVEYVSSHEFTIGRVTHSVDTRKRHHSVSVAPHCNDNATDEISEEVERRRRDELNRKRKEDEKKYSAIYLWKLNTVTN